jgi:hypothetical protein
MAVALVAVRVPLPREAARARYCVQSADARYVRVGASGCFRVVRGTGPAG